MHAPSSGVLSSSLRDVTNDVCCFVLQNDYVAPVVLLQIGVAQYTGGSVIVVG
jgi:hypothetical protein